MAPSWLSDDTKFQYNTMSTVQDIYLAFMVLDGSASSLNLIEHFIIESAEASNTLNCLHLILSG